MRCARCGKSNPGASWYCSKCGAALTDLNTADAAGRPLARLMRWGLLAAGVLVLAGVIAGLAATGLRGRRGTGGAGSTSTDLQAPDAAGGVGDVYAPVGRDGAGPDGAFSDGIAGESAQASPTIIARVPPAPTGRIVTPVPTARVRAGSVPWTAPRRVAPPIIDGRLDEWTGTPIVVDSVVYGADAWDGPDDVNGVALASWDDRALYLGVRVADDTFSQPSTGRRLHMGDSLELQVDTDLDGDWSVDSYNGDDWQIGLSPGDFDGRSPEAYVWRPVARPADAVEIGARLIEGGYVLEAAIPWPLLGVDPGAMLGLGVALNISDNDAAAPGQDSMVSSAPGRAWADPRTFGTLILGGSTD